MPNFLADPARSFALRTARRSSTNSSWTSCQREIAALRRAAQLADEAYAVFRKAVGPGRRQYELVADIEAFFAAAAAPTIS